MNPLVFTLNGVRGGSRTKDPNDANQYEVSALVPVTEIAKYISNGPYANLREGCSSDPTAKKKSNKIVRELLEQLDEKPAVFHRKNNGITIIADEAILDARGKDGSLEIRYTSPEFLKAYNTDKTNTQQVRGVTNGGTTAGAIREAVEAGIYPNDRGTAFVRVTVRCADFGSDEVQDIARGLNKNLQVDPFSDANYARAFDELKSLLEEAEFRGQSFPAVSYYYGDSGEYDIATIIKILTMFAMVNDEGEHTPAKAYTGTEGCLQYFQAKDGGQTECRKYFPILPQLVYLYEYIQANIREAYNTDGKFFSLTLFQDAEIAEKTLPFSHLTTTVKPSSGWILPILAAFIPLLSDNKRSWKFSPFDLFDVTARKMVTKLNEQFLLLGGSKGATVQALGRNPLVYESLQGVVQRALDQQLVRK